MYDCKRDDVDVNKLDSQDRKMTDCEKYIQSGISKGWCKEPSFNGKIRCTYVCDFFQNKIIREKVPKINR